MSVFVTVSAMCRIFSFIILLLLIIPFVIGSVSDSSKANFFPTRSVANAWQLGDPMKHSDPGHKIKERISDPGKVEIPKINDVVEPTSKNKTVDAVNQPKCTAEEALLYPEKCKSSVKGEVGANGAAGK